MVVVVLNIIATILEQEGILNYIFLLVDEDLGLRPMQQGTPY
jgi:hypothetical protein